MHRLDGREFRIGFAILVLFTGIAGDAWRNLFFWQGYGILVVAIAALSVVVLVHHRRTFRPASLPYPLLAFLLLAFLSVAWSYYPGFTLLGASVQFITTLAAVAISIALTWDELLLVLSCVFRLILGLSFLFEFAVATVIRHPIYPVWVVPTPHQSQLAYWSRDLLFQGGKIQGIVGSSSLLAMAALLGLIIFGIQLRANLPARSSVGSGPALQSSPS